MKKNILVIGVVIFIGSKVVRLFVNKYPEYQITQSTHKEYESYYQKISQKTLK